MAGTKLIEMPFNGSLAELVGGGTGTMSAGTERYADGLLGQAIETAMGDDIDTGIVPTFGQVVVTDVYLFNSHGSVNDILFIDYSDGVANKLRTQIRNISGNPLSVGAALTDSTGTVLFRSSGISLGKFGQWQHWLIRADTTSDGTIVSTIWVDGLEADSSVSSSIGSLSGTSTLVIQNNESTANSTFVDDLIVWAGDPADDLDNYARDRWMLGLGRLGKQTAGLATVESLANTPATSAFLPQLQPSGDVIVADQKRVAHAAPVNDPDLNGRSMVMDGSTNYFAASANAINASEAANGLTILARIKPSGSGTRTIIGAESSNVGLRFRLENDKLSVRFIDVNNFLIFEVESVFTIPNDQITYVGLSVDMNGGTGTNLFGSYRDGVSTGTSSGSPLTLTDLTIPFYIGALNGGGTAQNFYKGEIGDLVILDGAGALLSAGQLQAAIDAMSALDQIVTPIVSQIATPVATPV